MRVALINPPYLVIYKKLNIEQDASVPLGLLYIASMLEKHGHQVKVYDFNLKETLLSEMIDQISEFKPDMVGVTAVTPTFNSAQQIITTLKKAFPKVVMVMGGPHLTSLPKQSLEHTPAADFVIAGEGEYPMVELLKALEEGRTDFARIAGLTYRQDGKVMCNPRAPMIEDLDAIPWPAYHLLPIKEYSPSVVYRVSEKSTFVMSSRGCAAYCTFCANNVTGRRLRTHSIDNFIGKIKYLMKTYGLKHFHIVDDNFMNDQQRVIDICQRIIDENLKITWFIFARPDHCQHLETLKMMKKAGCVYLQFGIESGSEVILRQMGKKIEKDELYKACMNCKKAGLDYFNSFMIGNPKETRETVRETIDFAIKLDAIMSGFNILIPYPGTAIFKKFYEKDFVENTNWEKWNHITHEVPIDYRHTELTKAELDELRKECIRRYYLRPRQILRLLVFFRSTHLLMKFVHSSWKHLFFLFSESTFSPTKKKLRDLVHFGRKPQTHPLSAGEEETSYSHGGSRKGSGVSSFVDVFQRDSVA